MPDDERVAHFIITRFNVRWPGWDRDPPGLDWLRHRLGFFERFTAPSIAAQTTDSFMWLLYLHDGTPLEIVERIDAIAVKTPRMEVLRADLLNLDRIVADIRARCGSLVTHVITSRLDNDDGLANSYAETVREHLRPGDPCFVDLLDGYLIEGGRIHPTRGRYNAFNSMIEPIESMRTNMAYRHVDIANIAPVVAVPGARWLQVIHDRNLSNRGEKSYCVSPRVLRDDFAGIPGVPDTGLAMRLRFNAYIWLLQWLGPLYRRLKRWLGLYHSEAAGRKQRS